MSLISKQIEELRAYAADRKGELAKMVSDAADTIESLSEKLSAANMERSSQYYNDGWIPVTDRLPEEGLVIVACGKDGDALYVASADAVRESAYEGYVKAWMQIEPWKREEYETD